MAREQPDLLGVDLDAVRRDDARVEQACSGEAPDATLAVRVDEQRLDRLHRPLAASSQSSSSWLSLKCVITGRSSARQAAYTSVEQV